MHSINTTTTQVRTVAEVGFSELSGKQQRNAIRPLYVPSSNSNEHVSDETHNFYHSFKSQSVGAEIEFYLVDAKTKAPIDRSVFANAVTLNEQEFFIDDLYEQLKRQYIPVELIHTESGPGQLEIVLEYSKDPMVMADGRVAQENDSSRRSKTWDGSGCHSQV